jgi:hypothetical protein
MQVRRPNSQRIVFRDFAGLSCAAESCGLLRQRPAQRTPASGTAYDMLERLGAQDEGGLSRWGSGYGTVGPAVGSPSGKGRRARRDWPSSFVGPQPPARGVIHHGSLVRRLREWLEAKAVEDAQDLRSTRGGGVRAERDV